MNAKSPGDMSENVWVFLSGVKVFDSSVVSVAQPALNIGDFVTLKSVLYKVIGKSFCLSENARNSYWFDVIKV